MNESLDTLTAGRWDINDGQLCCVLQFSDFEQAFGFMQRVATVASRLDHHPDWKNSYNRAWICLITHQQKKITDKDVQLALAIEDLLEKLKLEY